MKIQNKRKITTMTSIVVAIVVGLALLSPTTIIPNVNATAKISREDQLNANIEANLPSVPSSSVGKQLETIALSHSEVQKIVNGRSYSIMAIGFSGNATQNPIKWSPVVSINVANITRISVTIDGESNSVKKVDSGPIVKATCCSFGPGYSVDAYSGSSNPLGLYAVTTAVSYNVGIGSMEGPVFLLLNGQEYNPSGNACLSTNVYSGYFAQAGFWYKPSGSPAAATIVADTSSSCNDVGSTVAYTSTDTYVFKIIPKSSPIQWSTTVLDVNTGSTYTLPRTGMHYAVMQGNNSNTSMWVENYNSNSVTSWSGRFGPNPSASATYYNGASFVSWPSDVQHDTYCSTPNAYPWAHQVMTTPPNSIANGGTVTWSMSTMANYAYGC